jgi:predicted nucleotidyltransferase
LSGVSPRADTAPTSHRARIDLVSAQRESMPTILASLQEPFRSALVAATGTWTAVLGDRLHSLVLFGSVARRQARPTSDIDLIVVAEGLPRRLADRRRPLLESWERARTSQALPPVEWNLVVKSPAEAQFHSPLYLDIVEEGMLIVDRGGFFEAVLAAMRDRMRALGSRRVYLPDGSWYWDLKPDFRFGEVVEI